jgi:predicted secreted hydrolase
LKRPVLHGKDGVHQKSTEHGSASHYVSLTRLESTGNLVLDGRESALSGLSWMDHEFFSNLLAEGQVGWDWFSMQFENGTELMLFRLRHREEQKSSSGGSFVQKDGTVVEIAAGEMQLQTTEHFRSRKTNATYPIGWRIAIPRLNVELRTTTHLRDQELVSKLGISPKYWEGAIECEGTMQGVAMRGKGYLELTGYADTVQIERDGPQVRGR